MTSLYDLSVGSYLQIVSGVQTVLAKGATFAEENGLAVDDFVAARLRDDMLPLSYQVKFVKVQSLDALQALEAGEFSPPTGVLESDYQGLQTMMSDTQTELEKFTEDAVNQYAGKSVIFKFSDQEIPFTAENFILSFSLPNLNFHATTAYDLLRQQGVPLGKRDYLGKMRVGV